MVQNFAFVRKSEPHDEHFDSPDAFETNEGSGDGNVPTSLNPALTIGGGAPAGVSAVPMAARVSQKVGAEEDRSNFLLMHAMGPNVAGVIGSAVAAGVFISLFGDVGGSAQHAQVTTEAISNILALP